MDQTGRETLLRGILPVLPTPFAPDGSVSVGAMGRIVDFAVRAGVDGLVFPGFASEVDELAAEERDQLLQAVVARAKELPVVAGASAADVGEVVSISRRSLMRGVNTVMIQAPKSLGAGAAAVAAF